MLVLLIWKDNPQVWKFDFLPDLILTEQSALLDCTQPESSFRIQQAVSRSRSLQTSISFKIFISRLMHGANFAPRWMRSAALGPIQKFAGSWKSTCCKDKLVTSTCEQNSFQFENFVHNFLFFLFGQILKIVYRSRSVMQIKSNRSKSVTDQRNDQYENLYSWDPVGEIRSVIFNVIELLLYVHFLGDTFSKRSSVKKGAHEFTKTC